MQLKTVKSKRTQAILAVVLMTILFALIGRGSTKKPVEV